MVHLFVRLITLLSISILFLIVPSLALAEDFSTTYDVLYEVNEQGITSVTQNVSLTNNVSDRYVSEYTVNVGSVKVSDFYAWDSLGQLDTDYVEGGDETQVTLKFNEQVVGKDKQLDWTFGYTTQTLAEQVGLVWEINLPKISVQSEITAYELTLKLPKSFGQEIYISPLPASREDTNDFYILKYNQDQLEQEGVSAAFGASQVLNFTLKYHLKNPKTNRITTEVAFPPDIISRQQLIYTSIKPSPDNVRLDGDGNYLATFSLEANQELNITAQGQARLFSPNFSNFKKGNLFEIPLSVSENYTNALPYWESDNDELSSLARELVTNLPTVYEQALALYNYVTSTLSYSKERVQGDDFGRRGALETLENPDQSICLDYADLLIALMRSVGIPAREVNGYAYTKDTSYLPSDMQGEALHAWVEYHEPYIGWVPVDPTWGSTSRLDFFNKLDTNHITFVRKGLSSEEPYPAGAYKTSDSQKGDVSVSFGSEEDLVDALERTPDLALVFGSTKLAWFNQATEVEFVVKNESAVTAYDGVVSLNLTGGSVLGTKSIDLGIIPPYGSVTRSFKIISPSLRYLAKNVTVEAGISWSDFEGRPRYKSSSRELGVGRLSTLLTIGIPAVGLGLGLYMIFHFLLPVWKHRKGSPQRPPGHHQRRLRDRGRLPSRRS